MWRTLTCTARLPGNVQEDPRKTTMYLTLWPHQIYYPVPEEYGAPRLNSADWTLCFCHRLFTEGNSAYCVEVQGHQGCLGGMFVCRNTKCEKQRDMLLWSLNWGLPTMPNAFGHMCSLKFLSGKQINLRSRTVCSAAEHGVPKLHVSKANLKNLNDSPARLCWILLNPPIPVWYLLGPELDKVMNKKQLFLPVMMYFVCAFSKNLLTPRDPRLGRNTLQKTNTDQNKTQGKSWNVTGLYINNNK